MKITYQHPFGPFLNVFLDDKEITALGVVEVDPEKGYALVSRLKEGEPPAIANDKVVLYKTEGKITFTLHQSLNANPEVWKQSIDILKAKYPDIAKYIIEPE